MNYLWMFFLVGNYCVYMKGVFLKCFDGIDFIDDFMVVNLVR